MFQHVDPTLAGYFAMMRDGWLDLAACPNKAPGGYCEGFPASHRPYIFMSAVGTQDDVQTLLHEAGHAFHFMESSRTHSLVWNYSGPLEFCEVASMGMELLAQPYLERSRGGFYDHAVDAGRAYTEHLEGIVTFLPYMAVVDAFQHWVYTEAPEDVTADQLDATWSALWDRFMQDVDYGGLGPSWRPDGTASCTFLRCHSTTWSMAWRSSARCRSGGMPCVTRHRRLQVTGRRWRWATPGRCPSCSRLPAWPLPSIALPLAA